MPTNLPAVLPPRPLTAEDDRSGFDCGRASLNNWFARHALANHLSGASRVNVLCAADTGRIIGYVTLSAGRIEREFMAKSQQRNQPQHIPITLLGQLAVDVSAQGHGHATSLLIFALRTALAASDAVGSMGVLTHPIDDPVRNFYARWGFADLPFDPQRAMFVRMSDVRLAFQT